MPKYDIHFYDTLRIKILTVEADSTKQAIEEAEKKFPDDINFEIKRRDYWETELANERTAVLVDPLDENAEVMYDHSYWYDWPGYIQRPWRAVELLKEVMAGKASAFPKIKEFLDEIERDKIKDLPHPSLQEAQP